MKKTFVTLFVMLSMLWSMGASAQTLVFHLIDGSTADVELTSAFRMFTAGNKINVILPDGSTKDFTQSDILTITYRETRGDVNRDNTVDVADIATIISIMAGGQEPVETISVTTGSATDITTNSAIINGTIENVDTPVNVGVLYGTSDNLSIEQDKKVTTTSKGDFTVTLNDLSAGTSYYYCAFAEVDGKYYYGATNMFTTDRVQISVTIDDARNVEDTKAYLNANLTFNIDITKKYTVGFFIATSGTPSNSNCIFEYRWEVENKILGFGVEFNELSANTTYYYRAFVLYDNVYYYSDTKSFKTKSASGYTSCPDSNHPHMIDLGLPSGTLWACCNVGASMPGYFGSFFAWRDTEPKSEYRWESYNHAFVQSADGNYLWNSPSNIAGTSEDAATANWGAPWQMPTKEQFEELIKNCTTFTTTQDGKKGLKFTGTNGGSIFLPSAGYWNNKQQYYFYNGSEVNTGGWYWTSMLNETSTQAYVFQFLTVWETGSSSVMSPCLGLPVRPVRK